MSWDIVKEYPHDAAAFTEGLEWYNGLFYESSGQYKQSDIRRSDPVTGKPLLVKKTDPRFFAEGLTVMNGKVYQITYKEGKCMVYNAATLQLERTITFPVAEGWGMTNNGTHLIFDDGTNTLHFVEPGSFKEVKQIKVRDEKGPVNEINELEMINGYIYANQWKTDWILKIDTATGRVVARADLSTLRQRGGIPAMSSKRNSPEVMNGIAWDKRTNRIFVTGKFWPKLFEVKLDN
jgi:glutamine cyclotransferase